eukprot:198482_1
MHSWMWMLGWPGSPREIISFGALKMIRSLVLRVFSQLLECAFISKIAAAVQPLRSGSTCRAATGTASMQPAPHYSSRTAGATGITVRQVKKVGLRQKKSQIVEIQINGGTSSNMSSIAFDTNNSAELSIEVVR